MLWKVRLRHERSKRALLREGGTCLMLLPPTHQSSLEEREAVEEYPAATEVVEQE